MEIKHWLLMVRHASALVLYRLSIAGVKKMLHVPLMRLLLQDFLQLPSNASVDDDL